MSKNYDVVIVGCGVAGLYAALNLNPKARVLLLCKQDLTLSNSSLAQGGVAAVIDTTHDSTDAHFNDTLIAGGFKNNPEAVHILVEQGPKEVKRIMEYGVDFDHSEDNSIHFTLEGGHSKPRILHHKDSTGYEMVIKLLQAVKTLPNVDIMENSLVCSIQKGVHFSLDILTGQTHTYVNAAFCILATGGIGRVYEYTTNSKIATGDGIVFAHKMGAKIKYLHYIQFHPTGFANKKSRETFLISESVRGEGAYLLNCHFERFMHKYDDRLELAPRDVVSRAIIEESKQTQSNDFYLDISYKDAQSIRTRFPMIYQSLLKEGIDMTTDKIPVFPCHHYLMGGIDVDLNSKTTIDKLYAVGECSHTGVHGNNRLASNSLLEALVFSRRAAEDINPQLMNQHITFITPEFPQDKHTKQIPAGIRTEVRHIMQKAHFVIPNPEEAHKGFERILELKKQLEQGDYQVNCDYVEAYSLVIIAYLILKHYLGKSSSSS